LDPTSPYKNRGDIIEVKINNGKSNEITKANKEEKTKETKAQMLRRLVIKTRT
jgi:hypothetical protein